MKLFPEHPNRGGGRGGPRRSESGSATFIFITLLLIMLILVTVNGKALSRLHREVRFIEQQQIKRLNTASTNAVAISRTDFR